MMHRGLEAHHAADIARHDSRLGPKAAATVVLLDEIRDPGEIPGGTGSLQEDPGAGSEATAEHRPNVGLFQDIPGSIWTIFLAGWAGFFLLMWLFFAVGRDSTFMVTVVMLFGLMAFGLPIAMAKQSNRIIGPRAGPIDTHTGPVSVRAAGVQIALIPIAVVVGLLGFILFAKP
jgi:hypothetical protein